VVRTLKSGAFAVGLLIVGTQLRCSDSSSTLFLTIFGLLRFSFSSLVVVMNTTHFT
jgi:hypothetical protein